MDSLELQMLNKLAMARSNFHTASQSKDPSQQLQFIAFGLSDLTLALQVVAYGNDKTVNTVEEIKNNLNKKFR
jgi:hypothetical protein